jgi:hypothetical protein
MTWRGRGYTNVRASTHTRTHAQDPQAPQQPQSLLPKWLHEALLPSLRIPLFRCMYTLQRNESQFQQRFTPFDLQAALSSECFVSQ